MEPEVIVRLGINLYLMIGFILLMIVYLSALDSGQIWPRQMWWCFQLVLSVLVVCCWLLFIVWGLIHLGGKKDGRGGGN